MLSTMKPRVSTTSGIQTGINCSSAKMTQKRSRRSDRPRCQRLRRTGMSICPPGNVAVECRHRQRRWQRQDGDRNDGPGAAPVDHRNRRTKSRMSRPIVIRLATHFSCLRFGDPQMRAALPQEIDCPDPDQAVNHQRAHDQVLDRVRVACAEPPTQPEGHKVDSSAKNGNRQIEPLVPKTVVVPSASRCNGM